MENRKRRRQHEHANSPGAARPHLACTLHIDHEYEVTPGRQIRFRVARACPVQIPEHIRELEERPGRDHLLEPCACNEIIVDAVDFPGPDRARRVRTREREIRHNLNKSFRDRGFAGA